MTDYLDFSLSLALSSLPPSPAAPRLYRILHDREMGGVRQIVLDKGVPLPEVHQLKPVHFTKLTYKLQWLWKDSNPLITGREWRKLAGCHRFATNNLGFDCAEKKHGPFADFVNGLDIGSPLPAIESIICGGAIVAGVEAIERGERVLWLETMRPDSLPDANDVPKWQKFEAVSVRPDGGVQSFSITPHAEWVPLVASQPVYIEMAKAVRL